MRQIFPDFEFHRYEVEASGGLIEQASGSIDDEYGWHVAIVVSRYRSSERARSALTMICELEVTFREVVVNYPAGYFMTPILRLRDDYLMPMNTRISVAAVQVHSLVVLLRGTREERADDLYDGVVEEVARRLRRTGAS